MRITLFAAALLGVWTVMAQGAVQVPEGYEVKGLGQDFMGGFDCLPNGDIIGMYTDPMAAHNAYVAIIDANGDGNPGTPRKVYDAGQPVFGAFVKVSPDGNTMLFEEFSLATYEYKIKRMDLSNYSVSDLVPASGSFDGTYDLAFIDNGHCYISANPFAAGGSTNKIFYLDLATRLLTEVVSVSSTYSGGIDVDDKGNLYYVKGKANYPVQPGDFTVLRFSAAALSGALAGHTVLGEGIASVIADGLDGGYDVAWHSSGALFVSDANNGKIYKVAPLSQFTTLSLGTTGGFTILSMYRRDQSFAPVTRTPAKLALGYLGLSGSTSLPDLYQVNPVAPAGPESTPVPRQEVIQLNCNGQSFTTGDEILINFTAQPTDTVCDAYAVIAGPAGSGALFSLAPNKIKKGMGAYAKKILISERTEGTLLRTQIPDGIPAGVWTIYAGLMPAGAAPSAANAFALDSMEFTIR
ncbi:MAG: hypothetical protein NTZ78_13015 [Candidatus Aureabacteria bacterium]|nr:hypothetical protein [Candidatus Auribacterota bacterium]